MGVGWGGGGSGRECLPWRCKIALCWLNPNSPPSAPDLSHLVLSWVYFRLWVPRPTQAPWEPPRPFERLRLPGPLAPQGATFAHPKPCAHLRFSAAGAAVVLGCLTLS